VTRVDVHLSINGRSARVSVEPRTSLADLLRTELELTGTHVGCEEGMCGACTVEVDGEPARGCLMFGVQADGCRVDTVEGRTDAGLDVVQGAFRDAVSFQCAFCAPGFIVSTRVLLRENPTPTDEEIREALAGNLCRCTGYASILAGARLAAERLAAP
jgi:carbon-monoxide dehydrogenase small subunit